MLSVILGNSLWLSTIAFPCPGICLITGKMPASIIPLHAESPREVTILGFAENDLSPIIECIILLLTSKHGAQLTLIPNSLSSIPNNT